MKKIRFAKGWGLARFIRLGLGFFIVGEGIHARDWGFIALGVLVLLSSFLNLGYSSCGKQCCCENQDNKVSEKC